VTFDDGAGVHTIENRRGGLSGPLPGALPALIGCYHPSRQNTNTGKLTPPMMDAVFRTAKRLLDA
jgi:uracil-DNA glycosylase